MGSVSAWGVETQGPLDEGAMAVPSFSFHTMLAAISILFLTASPSLGGVLCSKGTTADSNQTVVAQLEEDAKDDGIGLSVIKTNNQSLATSKTDPASSSAQ